MQLQDDLHIAQSTIKQSTSQPSNMPVRTIQIGTTQISVQLALIAIIIVSIGLRLASAVYQGNTIDTLPGVWDQVSYDGLARRILGGYGFSFGQG